MTFVTLLLWVECFGCSTSLWAYWHVVRPGCLVLWAVDCISTNWAVHGFPPSSCLANVGVALCMLWVASSFEASFLRFLSWRCIYVRLSRYSKLIIPIVVVPSMKHFLRRTYDLGFLSNSPCYAPSNKNRNCIPINHFVYKTNFEHLLILCMSVVFLWL